MRKNILLISMLISMFVFGLQIAEPAAATSWKTIDHGKFKLTNHYTNVTCNYKWTTYQKGKNYVKTVGYGYNPSANIGAYIYKYYKKVSKTKMKVSGKEVIKYYNYGTAQTLNLGSAQGYTKLTAVQCYWKWYRSITINELKNL